MLPVLEEMTDYTNDAIYERLLAFIKEKGVKTGYVLWPLRTAVFRQADHAGRGDRDHGSHRQGGDARESPRGGGQASEGNLRGGTA